MQQSFNRGDIALSYFKGYNRIPSFSGFNEYTKIEKDDDNDWVLEGGTYVDLLYSYHLTETSNIGGVFLFDDFTLRFDYALFKTYDDQDMEEYFDHENFYLVIVGNKDSTMTFLNQFENVEMIHYLDGFK